MVVVDTDAEAFAFASADLAAQWLEATDVVDGEFHGYDALGNVLEITARGEDVFVASTDDNAYDAAVADLQRVTSRNRVSGESLDEMIRSLIVPHRTPLFRRLR
ncbi:hypothetical protein AB0J74_14210 [Asanoa sp. NPDC049573]|uniref:hypothetical protein n=1 Tax=Asanoa sp. NPDC049573 TaxID=3155396 RepID=UPI0034192FEC